MKKDIDMFENLFVFDMANNHMGDIGFDFKYVKRFQKTRLSDDELFPPKTRGKQSGFHINKRFMENLFQFHAPKFLLMRIKRKSQLIKRYNLAAL